MKILLAIPEIPPWNIGGGGVVYENLITQYASKADEVVVLYGYYPNKGIFEPIKITPSKFSNVKYYQIPEIPYPKSLPFLRTVMPPTLNAWRQIRSIIREEKPDVAHVHGYGAILMNIISSALQREQIPYIYTLHGYPESQNKFGLITKTIWNFYINNWQNKSLQKAKRITAVSDFIAKDSRNIGPEKTITVYNGINRKEFLNYCPKFDIREKHRIPKDGIIIFSLGRIAEMKGFQNVIKLLPQIIDKGHYVKYLIAGEDDGYKNVLEKLISDLKLKDNVEFVGFQDLETKKQYIQQANIYAVPSLWEPFGLVVLEGVIFNKVILTSNSGGIKEILEGYPNKIVLGDDDVIGMIINKRQQPYEYNWDRFNWDKIADKYIEVMKDL